jgi:hypothetical protein
MFVAFSMLVLWYVSRAAEKANKQDRPSYENLYASERRDHLLLHIRQDVTLACNLLSGVLIMLGTIAEILYWSLK